VWDRNGDIDAVAFGYINELQGDRNDIAADRRLE
jgi:hypothetical protein